jgi:hypothetical protein
MLDVPRVVGTRYVVPLREGGSLPAVVETDDGTFVVKFRGAGQGARALVAELLVAGIGHALGLPVPRAAIVELDAGFGRAEPNPEIQDILRGSVGANFGLEYLAGALAFDPVVDGPSIAPDSAAEIVWLDAFVTNVDRTPRNANLLMCRGRLNLIDHGAALYVHHRWAGWQERIHAPFTHIAEHVLLPFAGDLDAADARMRPRLPASVISAIVDSLPSEWLTDDPEFTDTEAQRAAYVTYLSRRLAGPRAWLETAIAARASGQSPLRVRETHRVV